MEEMEWRRGGDGVEERRRRMKGKGGRRGRETGKEKGGGGRGMGIRREEGEGWVGAHVVGTIAMAHHPMVRHY